MKTVIYKSNAHIRLGIQLFRLMLCRVITRRDLIWRLMVRDICAKYRQSILGVVWAVIIPLINALVFTMLRRNVVSISDTPLPYSLYVFWGTSLWQLFAQNIIIASKSLVTGSNLVTKVNIPNETLVFASFGQSLLDFAVRLVLFAALLLIYGLPLTLSSLLVPLMIAPLFIFSAGCGLLLSMINSLFRDVTTIIAMIMAFCMLLTPGVVYPPAGEYPLLLLKLCNPASMFIVASQEAIAGAPITNPGLLAVMSGVSIVFFMFCWYVFYLAEPRIAERI